MVNLHEPTPKPKLKIKIAKQPQQARLKTEHASQQTHNRYRVKTEYNDENHRRSSRPSRPLNHAISKSIGKLPVLGNSTMQLKKRAPLAERPLANCVRTSHYKLMPPPGGSRPNHSLSQQTQEALSRSLEATKRLLR